MGVVELGTLDSQLSSCCERVAPSSVYHDPAWEGWRTAGAIGAEFVVNRKKVWYMEALVADERKSVDGGVLRGTCIAPVGQL